MIRVGDERRYQIVLVLERSSEAPALATPLTLDIERVSIVSAPFSGTSVAKCCGCRPCTEDDGDSGDDSGFKAFLAAPSDGSRQLGQRTTRGELLVESLPHGSSLLNGAKPSSCEIDDGDGLMARTIDDPSKGVSMPKAAIVEFGGGNEWYDHGTKK